jgi:cytochrome P450 / NADPH-cytochrome P450 reductase
LHINSLSSSSISSSPLIRPSHATISFSVLQAPSHTGQGTHLGVATSYLSSLSRGDKIQLAIRASPVAFSIPNNPAETPLICIAAGTGIAPFRGFMQERAAQRAAGRDLAPALLFFGCRGSVDDLYRDELDQWENDGVVQVKRAYSREPEKTEGCKHVQDRMMKEKLAAVELWRAGAKIYVCGSRGIADSVREAVITIKKAALMEDGKESEVSSVEQWFDELRNVRYVIDVFD